MTTYTETTTLRQLMIDSVMSGISKENLLEEYDLHEEDLEGLSDLDLFNLYESVWGVI